MRWPRDRITRALPSFLGLRDRARRVEPFRAGPGAVHDRVATIEPERVFEPIEPLAGALITTVGKPAVGLQQDRWSEVPPVARAGGRAAEAKNALPRDRRAWRAPRATAGARGPAAADRTAARARSARTVRTIPVRSGTRSFKTGMCGSGVIRLVPFFRLSIGVRQASVLCPSMFIAQEPHTPSRQDRRNDRVGSIWSLILTKASRTIGPQ